MDYVDTRLITELAKSALGKHFVAISFGSYPAAQAMGICDAWCTIDIVRIDGDADQFGFSLREGEGSCGTPVPLHQVYELIAHTVHEAGLPKRVKCPTCGNVTFKRPMKEIVEGKRAFAQAS